jgi:hypothetical protein
MERLLMNMRFLIIAALISLSTVQAYQLILLDEKHPIYKDSTNLMLEHAMTDFTYYYVEAGKTSGYDISIKPTYQYLNVIHGTADINMGGLFVQARGHYKKVWFKANTLLGGISEKFNDPDYPESSKKNSRSSFGGCDDLMLELGYDFYQVPQWGSHCSIFLFGGIPVNGPGHPICKQCGATISNVLVSMDDVRLGTGFYRLGAGLQASAIFYCREGGMKMLTAFTGMQWNYVFPRSWDQLFFSEIAPKPIPLRVHTNPGNEFSIWDALNFNYYEWGFELGVTAQAWGNFKERFAAGYKGKDEELIKGEIWYKSVKPVFGSVTPYITCSYGKTFKGNPYSLGLGIAYEFDSTDYEIHSPNRTHAYKNFQGVQIWGNFSYGF